MSESQGISLRDLIIATGDYLREILRSRWIILIAMVLSMAYFAYQAVTTKPTYGGTIKFLVEGDGEGFAGFSGLLGSLGISRKGRSNPYKVIEVAHSTELLKKVLFTQSQCGDGYLANSLVDKLALADEWAESDEDFRGFTFQNVIDSSLTRIERRALQRLIRILIGSERDRSEALLRINRDRESEVFRISASTEHECLTISIVDEFYAHLKVFFEEDIVADKTATVQVIAEKRDSIKNLLDQKALSLARFQDRSRGVFLNEDRVTSATLTNEIEGLTIAYAELIKNFEMADLSLRDSKPLFMTLDRPYPPLSSSGPVLLINLIIGAMIGFFLSAAFVIARKFYRGIMAD